MGDRAENCTLTAVGDVMMTRRLSRVRDEKVREVARILNDSDVAFANLETLIHDFEGYPSGTKLGTFMRAPPFVTDELDWCGIDVVAAASNHSFDYSYGGLDATMRELEANEIPYAGIGDNLAQARRPAYVDTPAGRVAVVAACSSITPGSIAGEQRRDAKGRPGLSPLRYDVIYEVPTHAYEVLVEMSEELGLEERKRIEANGLFHDYDLDEDGPFRLLICDGDTHPTIVEADDYRVTLSPRRDDIEAIKRQIDVAGRKADWVVASLHAHEGKGASINDRSVPQFLRTVAKNCIDIGADVFVGHGPHTIRGIEFYDGRPMFYSLGNFVSQYELIDRLPAATYETSDLVDDAEVVDLFDYRAKSGSDAEKGDFHANSIYWESILPKIEFEDGEVARIEIVPLDLQHGEHRTRAGQPRVATGRQAKEILTDLRELSRPYGTEVSIDGEVGVVRP